MSNPLTGDLLIQRLPGLPAEFVIADAVTRHTLASGYTHFEDAVAHAVTHAAKIGVTVWHLTQTAPGDTERLVAIVPHPST